MLTRTKNKFSAQPCSYSGKHFNGDWGGQMSLGVALWRFECICAESPEVLKNLGCHLMTV